jgi:hypothetical protein
MDKILKLFLKKSIENACKTSGISAEYLHQIPSGNRKRSIHDDITIILCSLEN